MTRVVDITYYSHLDLHSAEQIRLRHGPSIRYSEFLSRDFEVTFIMHAGFKAQDEYRGVKYYIFKGINKFFFLPFLSSRFIAQYKPDLVLVQGLGFPVQVLLLRLFNPHVKILVQHHGERPFKGVKLLFQQLAANFVNGWLFTASGNALLWKQKHVIKANDKIFEVLEASTEMQPLDYTECRSKLGMKSHEEVFVCVGRLVRDKNPLLLLNAFRSYVTINAFAKLYLIYQEDDLLSEVKAIIDQHPELARAVCLVGKVPHVELAAWYSAADFYLSASNREGSGYALIEAIACGCMPVVTDIPSYEKITGNGRLGLLYETGNAQALLLALLSLWRKRLSRETVKSYFESTLSFECIARDLSKVITGVCSYNAITRLAISSAEKSNTGS
jgi:glycosyltransferase involved in cell wall biosynthesis